MFVAKTFVLFVLTAMAEIFPALAGFSAERRDSEVRAGARAHSFGN